MYALRRRLTLGHVTRFRILSEMLVQLTSLHRCDDRIQRRDELIFARHYDCRFAAELIARNFKVSAQSQAILSAIIARKQSA